MQAKLGMLQYQRQAVMSSSPEQLIAKLYDIGITSCHRGDASKVRAVLVELISSLNFEAGGELARNLFNVYQFCLEETTKGQLDTVGDLLGGLRDAWRQGVLSAPKGVSQPSS
jgi:flagellar secretion chaperone FliS